MVFTRYCQLCVILLCSYLVLSDFNCYDCTGGPNTICGKASSIDMTINCATSCYEAYIEYQNGALPLVERRCWNRPRNSNASNYCDWFRSSKVPKNTNGKMISCRSCTSDRCNGNTGIIKPSPWVVQIPSKCS